MKLESLYKLLAAKIKQESPRILPAAKNNLESPLYSQLPGLS